MIANPAFAEVTTAIRTMVALVFVSAAVGKMRNWIVFQGVIANYRLLPQVLVAPVAFCLPPFEALLGAALLLGVFSPWPEAVAAALLLAFAGAMGINISRGRRHIDCGCFQTVLKQTLSWTLVARNAALALLLCFAALCADAPADRRAAIAGLLVGAVMFVILQSLNILWSIVPAWPRPARQRPAWRRPAWRRAAWRRPLDPLSGVDP